MRKMTKPTDDAAQVFRTCISNMQDQELKQRLESIVAVIADAAIGFESAAVRFGFYQIPRTNDGTGIVTKKELIDVYDKGMVQRSLGRVIYNKILMAPPFGICPLCGQRTVSSLDHYLPKSHYPVLAVVPVNLIPACAECNKIKSEKFPTSAKDQTLHPYYDDVDSECWLSAKVLQGSPVALLFFVKPPEEWCEIKVFRVKHHF